MSPRGSPRAPLFLKMNAAPHLGKIAFNSTTTLPSRRSAATFAFVSFATGDDMNGYCDIAASDGSGSMKAYLAMPTGKPKAGIVVIQEIFGVNKDIRAMTDAWAANGYAAIAPDLFWRLKPGVELDADIPDEFQKGLDLLQKFNADKSMRT